MLPRALFSILRFFWIAAFSGSLAVIASGQTINPADYGTITLRLAADTLALPDNAAVTSWGLLTAAGTAQPLYVASDPRFNNKPVVKFDGVNDLMTWPSAGLKARTIFAVVTMESPAGTGNSIATLFSDSNDNLGLRRNGTVNAYSTPGNANDFTGNTPAGTITVNNSANSNFTAGTPHVLVAVAGAQKTFATFWLGNAKSTLARYWNGSVAEIIVYDGVLTATGIDRVGYYLQSKYNIAASTFPTPTPAIGSFTAAAGGLTAKTGVLSTAGAPVTLAWNASNTTTVSIDHGALASSSNTTGSVTVSPSVTTTYTLSATNSSGTATRAVTVYLGVATQPLVLNEFLADNASSILDEDGAKQDWIELYNPNPFAVSANGWQLVDGATTWLFPNLTVEGGAYPVIFASGKNRTNPATPLHTNFSLGKNGEYLALKKPDGTVVTEFAPAFPAQRPDISAGFSGGTAVYYSTPTPGMANGSSITGFVADTDFSVHRGFFTTSQNVAITCATAGATIRYTTDNSTPTETNGTIYTAPLTIGGTTVLRARAFVSGLLPSNTDTQTYIFTTDVPNQIYPGNTPPPGWVASGVNGQAIRYGFNSSLLGGYTAQQVQDALKQVSTISIVTDQVNLTDATIGLYVNADQKGDAWERPASVELLNPDATAGFHINAGLRIRGGASRGDTSVKHSFRLYFRSQYGDASLKYPLHGASGTDEFQTIDIRTEQNYSWAQTSAGTQNTAVREVFCRDLMGAMGQPTTRSRYLQLYLNGQYWGLYQTEERAQEDYGASYFGGSSDDYDVVQTSNHPNFTYELSSGTIDAWQQLWTLARAHAANVTPGNYFKILGRNADGTRNPALPVLIDPEHLSAYMLLNYYTGDGDAPLSGFLSFNLANNWRGMRNRLTTQGFRFFVHDSEHTLMADSWVDNRPLGKSATVTTINGSNRNNFTYSNSEWIHEDMALSPEYRMTFADVAQRMLFNGGPMTPAPAQALFDARAALIDKAIIADATRWGTASNASLANWQARLNTIRSGFFPTRHTNLLAYLRARGFFPSVNAPAFSQRGGTVGAGSSVTLSASGQTGTIYFTLDGSDPRAIGGAVAAGAQTYANGVTINGISTVRTRFLASGTNEWSALDAVTFTTYPPGVAGKLVVSKLHYHPTNPTAAENPQGTLKDSDFEYVELLNIGAETIDLRGVQLSDAVTFSFASAAVQSLVPGGRVLVVGNLAAFSARYGSGLPVAGAFAGNFSDSTETLRVSDLNGTTIVQFAYHDTAPWPAQADGNGAALVLKNPTSNPDPSNPTNWQASYIPGGKPGVLDAITIGDWRAMSFSAADLADPAKESTVWGNAADPDRDGFTNLQELALGGSPTSGQSRPVSIEELYTDPATSLTYLRLTVSIREGTSGLTVVPEASSDLASWQSGLSQIGAPLPQGNGTSLVTFQDTMPTSTAPGQKRFMRIRIQAN